MPVQPQRPQSADTSDRLRALEVTQVNLQTRLGAAEQIQGELRKSIDAMRTEQRDDAQRIFGSLDEIRRQVSMSAGMYKALAWVAGLGVTIGAAALGVWAAIRGGS